MCACVYVSVCVVLFVHHVLLVYCVCMYSICVVLDVCVHVLDIYICVRACSVCYLSLHIIVVFSIYSKKNTKDFVINEQKVIIVEMRSSNT